MASHILLEGTVVESAIFAINKLLRFGHINIIILKCNNCWVWLWQGLFFLSREDVIKILINLTHLTWGDTR